MDTALILCGCVTAFWGLLGWIFRKKLVQWCNWKTLLIALGLAVMVGIGIWSGLSLLSCYFLTNPSRHPIRYPASGALSFLCLGGFIGLFCLYCHVRKQKPSVPGVILEVVMSISYCVPFLYLCAVVHAFLSELI